MTPAAPDEAEMTLGWCSTCEGEVRNDGTHDCTCGNITISGNLVRSNGWPIALANRIAARLKRDRP